MSTAPTKAQERARKREIQDKVRDVSEKTLRLIVLHRVDKEAITVEDYTKTMMLYSIALAEGVGIKVPSAIEVISEYETRPFYRDPIQCARRWAYELVSKLNHVRLNKERTDKGLQPIPWQRKR